MIHADNLKVNDILLDRKYNDVYYVVAITPSGRVKISSGKHGRKPFCLAKWQWEDMTKVL